MTKLAELEGAETDLATALADAAAAEDADAAAAVDDLIDALSDPITTADEGDVTAARAAYNGLNQARKDLVTKLAELEGAESDLATALALAAPPFIVSIELAPSTSVWYGIGDEDDLKITFNEPIEVSGTPTLTLLSNDGFDLTLTYKSHEGAEMIVSYTLEENVTPADLFAASYSFGSFSGGISDLDGNFITDPTSLIPSQQILNEAGASLAEIYGTWDVTKPTVESLILASEFAEPSYKIGDTVVLEVTFSEDVLVTGIPVLTMETNGGFDVVLRYRGPGTTDRKILVDYVVQEGVDREDLRLAQYSDPDVDGGIITDVAENLPNLAPSAEVLIAAVASLATITTYDVLKPYVENITVTSYQGVLSQLFRDGLYQVGEMIPFRVRFNEDISFTNVESLTATMNSGASSAALYVDHGDDYVEFAYVVQPGDSATANDLNVESINLNGAEIRDAAGNSWSPELPEANEEGSLDWNRDITVDASAPQSIIVSAGPGSLTVTITDPTWVPQLYSFEASRDGQVWQGISSSSKSATIGGLLGNTIYQVRAAGVSIVPDLEDRLLVNGRSKMAVAGFIYSNGTTTSVQGPAGAAGAAGAAGPAGPAGAPAPTSTVSTQALAIAIANAESATALANEKATALDVAKAAAELAKNQTLEAAQLAKSNAEKLAVELALLAQKKNSVSVKISGNTSQIAMNLSDEFAKSQAVIQVKKPKTMKYVTLGRTMLNASGDGTFRVKGKIAKGSYIRILIEGVVVKTHIV